MAITNTIKRAPRWAWYTAGGVGLGAIALKFYNNRDKPESDQTTANEGDMYAGGIGAASPAYGIVTPSIVPVESSPDPSGLLDSMIGGIDTLLTSTGQFWQDVWGPTQEQNANMLAGIYGQNQALTGLLGGLLEQQQSTIGAIATAGSPPAPIVQAPPPPAISAPAPSAPAPQTATSYVDQWITRTRDNGKSGAARRVWCNCINVHRYPDGRAVVVSERKVADGACWAEGYACTP